MQPILTLDRNREHEPARQQVERFVRRFEPSYRQLAYYVALPLVLTPELVNYLRCQFLGKVGVPWVAEADLLLSDLCNPVGYEQYAIEPAVRAYLLSEMEQEIGRSQMQAVARLLLSYVRQLALANPDMLRQQELEHQQMAAMVYLDDQRETVVQKLIEEFQACAAVGKISAEMVQAIQSKLDQLVRMTQEMAPQLRDNPELVAYAELLRQVLDEPQPVDTELLERRFEVAPGLHLAVPSVLTGGKAGNGDRDDQWLVFEYEVVTVAFEGDGDSEDDRDEDLDIHSFEFDVDTVIVKEKGHGAKKVRPLAGISKSALEIQKQRGQTWQFIEPLGHDVVLEMVSIPSGEFLIGSPSDELERYEFERPQHLVTVSEFYLGKYSVTQAQWRVVAGLPQVNQELDPDPSNFKGVNRPVEQVSWEDAVEFCDRLSLHTRREYRLPSEAEWEYACRAQTTTSFHFGETIATDLANYRGTDWQYEGKTYLGFYGAGSRGEYREQTIDVGTFSADAFGLYDMHGNV